MSPTEVYLDHAASTPALPEVSATVVDTLVRAYGNPSSLHGKGLEAERIVKDARLTLARALGVRPDEVYFTSGGTEGNHLAVKGGARARGRSGRHVVTSAIEHASVLQACQDLEREGFTVSYVRPQADGRIDPRAVQDAVTDDTVLVSIMAVNNETGAIQPLEAIARSVRAVNPDALLHSDGVQAFMKVRFEPKRLGLDLVSVSGHKVHAPKGVGALFVRKGVNVLPLFGGGSHEGGLRSGTENVPGIAGLGKAVSMFEDEVNFGSGRLDSLRAMLVRELRNVPETYFNGPGPDETAPHIVSVSFPGVRGEVLLRTLEAEGVYVSTGSACSSRKGAASHVLRAMDLPEDRLQASLRLSLSHRTTEDEVRHASRVIAETVVRLRNEL